jgi:hypothetical protein
MKQKHNKTDVFHRKYRGWRMKEVYTRWRKGMRELTPLQLTRAKATGHLYGAIGISIAFIGLVYKTITDFSIVQLGFSIFIFFIIWLQINEYISTKQKVEIMVDTEERLKELKQTNEKIEKLGL